MNGDGRMKARWANAPGVLAAIGLLFSCNIAADVWQDAEHGYAHNGDVRAKSNPGLLRPVFEVNASLWYT